MYDLNLFMESTQVYSLAKKADPQQLLTETVELLNFGTLNFSMIHLILSLS